MNNTKTTLLSNKDIMALKASSCDEYCIFFPFGLGVGIEPFSFPCAHYNGLTVYNQAVLACIYGFPTNGKTVLSGKS
jgi:hypothetical protein